MEDWWDRNWWKKAGDRGENAAGWVVCWVVFAADIPGVNAGAGLLNDFVDTPEDPVDLTTVASFIPPCLYDSLVVTIQNRVLVRLGVL